MLDNMVESPTVNSTEDNSECLPVICKQHNLSLRIRTSSSSGKSYMKKQGTVDSPTVVSPPMENKYPVLQRELSTDESRNENNNNVNNLVNKNLGNCVSHVKKKTPDGNHYLGDELNANYVNFNHIKQLSLDETLLNRVDSLITDEKTKKQHSLDDSIIRHTLIVNTEAVHTTKAKEKPKNAIKTNVLKHNGKVLADGNPGPNFAVKNKLLLSTNKKVDSLQWLKRQFSLANKETNYFRNIKMQR